MPFLKIAMMKAAATFLRSGLLFALFFGAVGAQESATYDYLRAGFTTPPPGARPKVYYWWLNGNVDQARIKEEIAAMDRAGISGFDIFEIGVRSTDTMVPAGPAFLSPESLQSIKVAVDEAQKYDMEVGLNMASSWNAGGAWITPENSAKSLYFSQRQVGPGDTGPIKLPFPEISEKNAAGKKRFLVYQSNGRPAFYQEVAIVGVPLRQGHPSRDPREFLDLSSRFDAQTEELNWVPTGDWIIYRYGCANSGERLKQPSAHSVGPIIDHFDAQATEAHFTYVIEKLIQTMGDLRATALKSLYLASYEATGFVWTTSLPDLFAAINGYEVARFLPVIFEPTAFAEPVASKVKRDLQRTLSELMITNFYQRARAVANRYGLKINSESGGPGLPLHNVPAEPLRALGAMDLPRGEFWVNHSRFNEAGIDMSRVVKEVSAAAHLYGRGIVEEEAFTTFQHWQEGPFDLKPYGDRAFAEGMNRVVIHGFSHSPDSFGSPGIAYHAGTHFNDRRVWFSKIRPFNDYLARTSFVLQESEFVADVLYY